jgi:hypothetical protein
VIKALHLIEVNFLDPIEEVEVVPSVNHYSAMTYIEKYALFQLMVEQSLGSDFDLYMHRVWIWYMSNFDHKGLTV